MSRETPQRRRMLEQLGPPPEGDRVDAQRATFQQALDGHAPRRGFRPALAFAVAALLAAVVSWRLVSSSDSNVLHFEVPGAASASAGTWTPVVATAETAVSFSEGSTTTFSAGSAGQLMVTDTADVRIGLGRGEVDTDVKLKGRRRWAVEAGPYQVIALGTRYVVRWQPETQRLHVVVKEGRVRVEGPGVHADTVVSAGNSLELAPPPPTPEVREVAPAADGLPSDEVADASVPVSPSPTVKQSAPLWKRLAARGDFASAIDSAEAEGLTGILSRASVEDLLLLADAARYSRRGEVAKRALEATRSRFKHSRQAVMAAYVLGRVLDEQLSAPGAAAGWLEVYLTEDPRGPLAEEAMGRRIDLYLRAGESTRARDAARAYLVRFPSGVFAGVARSVEAR